MGKPITAEQVVSMWCSGYGVLAPSKSEALFLLPMALLSIWVQFELSLSGGTIVSSRGRFPMPQKQPAASSMIAIFPFVCSLSHVSMSDLPPRH
jgi:hypothetical protein